MKYIKTFEKIKEDDIDFDKVYYFENRQGYKTIFKFGRLFGIGPLAYKSFFDNSIYNNVDGRMYMDNINFEELNINAIRFDHNDLRKCREATIEETEAYYLAIESKKYDL